MSDYENWRNPFAMGAVALLCLGGSDDRASRPAQQALYKPRYYVPDGPQADMLRSGRITNLTIRCSAHWQTVTARNIIAVVPAAGTLSITNSAAATPIALAAPYDSMSVVTGLAPGADDAIDAAFLLNTLRHYAANPPQRPLLFCFIDAYHINQLGSRALFTLLTATSDDATRRDYEKLDSRTIADYRALARQMDELGNGPPALDSLWDKSKYRQLQRCIKDELGPGIIELRENNGSLRLRIQKLEAELRDTPENKTYRKTVAELHKKLQKQTAELRFKNNLLTQILTKTPITAEYRAPAVKLWNRTRERVMRQLASSEGLAGTYAKLDSLRAEINHTLGQPPEERPVEFVMGFDFSDGGTKSAPGLWCAHLLSKQTITARTFTRWIKSQIRGNGALADSPLLQNALNIPATQGSESPLGFNPSDSGLITSPAESFLMSAVTWRTVDGIRPWIDTPADTFERIRWDRLENQIALTSQMLNLLINSGTFEPEPFSAGRNRRAQWRCPRGTIVRESLAETVPRTPEPDMLVTFLTATKNWDGFAPGRGIRRNEFITTAPDGSFRFQPIPRSESIWLNAGRVEAFRLDENGAIIRAISDSASMLAGRVSSEVNLYNDPDDTPVRAVTFRCAELNGPIFFDPRFLEPLNVFQLIDTKRGGTPKRFHFSIHRGQMFGLLMPDTRWQLILQTWSAAKRMSLMNVDTNLLTDAKMTPRDALKRGFGINQKLPSIPSHLSTIDLHAIDVWRRDKYARAGIISKPIDELLADTDKRLKEIERALADDDGAALHRESAAALAGELRAYNAIRATADDITRGAVFLMLLLVPFAVVVERLVIAATKIGLRIAGAAAIFSGMTAILWSFHPAFRITSQPIIILMAFSILLLSMVVIIIIMRKFENDLTELRSGRAEAGAARTARSGIIGSAVWLGIANMRKRKLRTALTATTIILITFSLLCFSSTSAYQTRRELTLKNVPPPGFSGVLIHLPGMQAMARNAERVIANLVPEAEVAPRFWLTKSYEPEWRLHAVNPATGAQISLKAALGLSTNEIHAANPGRLMLNRRKTATGSGCYISTANANNLGIKPGGKINLAGKEFILAGTFDGARIGRELRMIDGQSLLPFDYTMVSERYSIQAEIISQLASGSALQVQQNTPHVSGDDVIILPAEFVRRNGGYLRSIALPARDNSGAVKLAARLMDILAFPMYCTTDDGVKAMVSTPLIAHPPRSMLVPLLIAALIIFNTMLNSVAERKGEIHIYTSLGLAPRHVGVLFVAEALTYGLIGTISGYILGQGLATVLAHFNLMGGITLNYSGTNVIMTMGLVLLVVVLSAIVPAIMAGRLAAPGENMRWKVPQPADGCISDLLPFTVTAEAAGGLAAFVYEFLEAHSEGSIGTFSTDNLAIIPPTAQKSERGSANGAEPTAIVAGISGTVWLAPYDLGVRQHFELTISPDEENICGIHIRLIRETGQERTWWRLNRAFLADIRKQLLGWRRVPAERVMLYVENAEQFNQPAAVESLS
jgi:hypothetical protein